MRIHLIVLPDNTVSLMTSSGETMCNFHTMDHAISFCREWQTSDQDMLYPHEYITDTNREMYESMDMDVNSSSCSI